MPLKDVNVNGQVKYAVRETPSLKNMFAHILGSNIRTLTKIGNNSSKPELPYASCFSDGMYRYSTNFPVAGDTEKSNIVKLVLSQIKCKYQ
jgi:hypothetical protein